MGKRAILPPICALLMVLAVSACGPGEPPGATLRRAAPGEAEAHAMPAHPADSSAASARAECNASAAPVVVTVLASPAEVQARRTREAGVRVVSEDPRTVAFADGRILTSDLEEVGHHLSRLGWIEREIVISSRFHRGGGAALRRRG